MTIGTVLPHLKKFGGVRRFLEIGNRLVKRGHIHLLSVEPGDSECDWMEYRGKIVGVEELLQRSDVLLVGDPPSLKYVSSFPPDRLYVYVIAGGEYYAQYDEYYKRHPFLLVNRVFQERYPEGKVLEGAVNTQVFKRTRLLRVGYYAGRGRTKGQREIETALSNVQGVQLIPIRGIAEDGVLCTVYNQLDYFVSWEMREGWSNTAAEALACGIPVVTSGRNVEAFRDRCIVVEDLRKFFLFPMEEFDWDGLVDGLLRILQDI